MLGKNNQFKPIQLYLLHVFYYYFFSGGRLTLLTLRVYSITQRSCKRSRTIVGDAGFQPIYRCHRRLVHF